MRVVSLLFHDVFAAHPRESGFASDAADRYKLSAAECDAQLGGLAAAGAASHPFVITVDDGGVSYYTMLADRLEARGWRGHCFISTDVVGSRGFLDPAQIRELDARGHVIGSHTASHPGRFNTCTLDRMRHEWTESRRVLEDLLGHEVAVASVPGGCYSRAVAHTALEAGLCTLFTSEPTTTIHDEQGCRVIGRFTIRRGDNPETARRLVLPAPLTRWSAWARWNAKGLVKPLLGSGYVRAADLLLGPSTVRNTPYTTSTETRHE